MRDLSFDHPWKIYTRRFPILLIIYFRIWFHMVLKEFYYSDFYNYVLVYIIIYRIYQILTIIYVGIECVCACVCFLCFLSSVCLLIFINHIELSKNKNAILPSNKNPFIVTDSKSVIFNDVFHWSKNITDYHHWKLKI